MSRTLHFAGERELFRIGFGAMRVTGPGGWGEPADAARAREVLAEAVLLGVQLIDTADSYGPEISERLVAEALHPYPDDVVIATKGGHIRTAPWTLHPDGRPEHLRAACEGSLKRLRLDTIELYYLHAPDPEVPFEESVGALVELQQEGKIRHIGLSNLGVDGLRRGQRVATIAAVQNRYNLGDRGHEAMLRACEEDGIAFAPWFPLEKGVLARGASGALRDVAGRHDATPAQIALAWLLHRSPLTLPIPGTMSLGHLRENVAAADISLDEADLARLEAFRVRSRTPKIVKRIGRTVLSRAPRRLLPGSLR